MMMMMRLISDYDDGGDNDNVDVDNDLVFSFR